MHIHSLSEAQIMETVCFMGVTFRMCRWLGTSSAIGCLSRQCLDPGQIPQIPCYRLYMPVGLVWFSFYGQAWGFFFPPSGDGPDWQEWECLWLAWTTVRCSLYPGTPLWDQLELFVGLYLRSHICLTSCCFCPASLTANQCSLGGLPP